MCAHTRLFYKHKFILNLNMTSKFTLIKICSYINNHGFCNADLDESTYFLNLKTVIQDFNSTNLLLLLIVLLLFVLI